MSSPSHHIVKATLRLPQAFRALPAANASGKPAAPQMGVIHGATRQLLYKVAVGAGAHSVAVDSGLGEVYVTFQAGTSTAFANGGMSVFATK